jgi:hypothetical protein
MRDMDTSCEQLFPSTTLVYLFLRLTQSPVWLAPPATSHESLSAGILASSVYKNTLLGEVLLYVRNGLIGRMAVGSKGGK